MAEHYVSITSIRLWPPRRNILERHRQASRAFQCQSWSLCFMNCKSILAKHYTSLSADQNSYCGGHLVIHKSSPHMCTCRVRYRSGTLAQCLEQHKYPASLRSVASQLDCRLVQRLCARGRSLSTICCTRRLDIGRGGCDF